MTQRRPFLAVSIGAALLMLACSRTTVPLEPQPSLVAPAPEPAPTTEKQETKEERARRLATSLRGDDDALDKKVAIIILSGDEVARAKAEDRLLVYVRWMGQPAWRDAQRETVVSANKRNGLLVSEQQLQAQIAIYQAWQLASKYVHLSQVAGANTVEYALGEANDATHTPERRLAAVRLLQGVSTLLSEEARAGLDELGLQLVAAAQNRAPMQNAAQVVADLRPSFTFCYQESLNNGHVEDHRYRLTLKVAATGAVEGVATSVESKDPDPQLTDCIKRAARSVVFEPPKKGMAAISIPISFVRE